MTLNFPTEPTDGQIYSYNGLGWQWNQPIGAWSAVVSQNPINPVTILPGVPWSAYLSAGDAGTIYTASSSTTVAMDLMIRAEGDGTGGAEDVAEMSRVTATKGLSYEGTPIITVYGQVTNNDTIPFTHYDVSLDMDGKMAIIAETAPHDSSRKFTYQVTEYGA